MVKQDARAGIIGIGDCRRHKIYSGQPETFPDMLSHDQVADMNRIECATKYAYIQLLFLFPYLSFTQDNVLYGGEILSTHWPPGMKLLC